MKEPELIIILSGKRKSGKDYVCQKIVEQLNRFPSRFACKLITLSSPLKESYALEHGLDYKRLLDSSSYKEQYRVDMIRWSELKRKEDPSFFCSRAVNKATKDFQANDKIAYIWIVTDARRQTDLDYFQQTYQHVPVKTIRIKADEKVRIERNWQFTQGVDDCESECGLDSITNWDFIICNNNELELEPNLADLYDYLMIKE